MRIVLAIIALAALGWTGWWFLIASAKEAALNAWLAERRAAGWVADAEAVEVAGFPYRVDTTVRGLELANPEAGWAWSAPEFQFLTLAYQPNHLIAIWPTGPVLRDAARGHGGPLRNDARLGRGRAQPRPRARPRHDRPRLA